MKDKNIKIYLQYPWKFPDSPYYKYLIDSPPEGIEFLNTQKQKGVITNKKFFLFSNFLKNRVRSWPTKLKLAIPNAHLSPKGNYDLIHCCHCLSKNIDKPWVADLESWWSAYLSSPYSERSRKKVEKILISPNCKKLMPWTEATKEIIVEKFPRIKNKIEVVYPAIPERKERKDRENKKLNLIFTGRYFYQKGGHHALEVIDRLTKKYPNVWGIFNSEVPEDILKGYSKNKKIKFFGLIPQSKLFELYGNADILIYPGYSDSFGFAYLEAMSFGVPIITTDGFARKEIVEEGKTGFVIDLQKRFIKSFKYEGYDKKVIDELANKTSMLIEDKKLRKRMSKECIKTIKSGKFSITERDKKLKRIYREAIGK
ncbi:glycosyltransferase family 4 protein [Candidatus Pacearchaeota archaeon]|nr:glycosyltransferase family 4 protein [Candidatus Pacearchaeota archaeon]